MIKTSRVVFALIALYLLVVLAWGLYVFYREAFAPENSEFSALGLVVFTLPWSMVLDGWLRPERGGSSLWLVTRHVLYALINVALFYALYKITDRGGRRAR